MELPAGPGSALSFGFPLCDQRTVFRGVSRQVYESLRDAPTDGRHVRLAYDGSDLEIIMVIGNIHEHWKELFAKIVNAVTYWLNIDYMSCGQTTWQTATRGLEADLSYYFDAEKMRVAREALARESKDQDDYPPPTWLSRSTCLLPKSIALPSMPTSALRKSGDTSGARS